ncbi:hypothetical protein CDD81_4142 [Ophiocordyceps australis]|uniref:C2H2-type domain-containing protein n=1 Tax=Ophiocordyceps australis TaxID=1399860 RepID=A0A2C5YCV4_9HYPO|nr:hypothetical protein CDD81_4142 [Ophiocordyceps australis]
MDSCLLLDAEASAVPQVYWSDYNLDLNLNAEGSTAFPLAEPGPLHVVPAQMHLGAASGLPDASSPGSWECFSSTISRTSSPTTNEDTWLSGSMSPHSSPEIKCPSPSDETKLSMIADDANELAAAHIEEALGLPQDFGTHRQGSDSESARDHKLYKNAAPHKDGLFHCPWEPQCSHKPEKLKCNYDKFIDSHLKPYRCKVKTCQAARFSSTACLLRHEREAHGLHGHGEKPFLCTHVGCERSTTGHGFPRQWNLRDHMKRVHNDHSSSSGSPPAASAGQVAKGRKRKTDVPEQTCPSRKATVKAMPVAEPAPLSSKPLLDEWMDHRRAIENMMRGLHGPEDSRNLQQITEAQKHLSAMAKMAADHAVSKRDALLGQTRRSYPLHRIKEEA